MIDQKMLKRIITISVVAIILITLISIVYQYFFTKLEIVSNYAAATIKVDGKELGTAPITTTLRPGIYTITGHLNGYKDANISYQVKPFSKNRVELTLSLKRVTDAEWAAMSYEEKRKYEDLSDASADLNEATLRRENPLTKYLPYSDSGLTFKIDYSGTVFNIKYIITVYGSNDAEIKNAKSRASQWIKSMNINPSTLNIQYIEERYTTEDNNYLE